MQSGIELEQIPSTVLDHRRFPRHRLSPPTTVWLLDGPAMPGITVEISARVGCRRAARPR